MPEGGPSVVSLVLATLNEAPILTTNLPVPPFAGEQRRSKQNLGLVEKERGKFVISLTRVATRLNSYVLLTDPPGLAAKVSAP